MKRMHISLGVADIERSRAFYAALFGSAPTLERDGYVQWLLDDPRVNFVVERQRDPAGVTHLGIQSESEDELAAQFARVDAAGGAVFDEGETTCCYARSTKNWTTDPDGNRWETFLTHERTGNYGTPADIPPNASTTAAKDNAPQACCCG